MRKIYNVYAEGYLNPVANFIYCSCIAMVGIVGALILYSEMIILVTSPIWVPILFLLKYLGYL